MAGFSRIFRPVIARDFGEISRSSTGPLVTKVSLALCEGHDGQFNLRIRCSGATGLQLHFVEHESLARLSIAVDHAVDFAPAPPPPGYRVGLWSMMGAETLLDFGSIGDTWLGRTQMTMSLRLRRNRNGYSLRFSTLSRRKGVPALSNTFFYVHHRDFAVLQAALHEALAIIQARSR